MSQDVSSARPGSSRAMKGSGWAHEKDFSGSLIRYMIRV